MKSTHNLSLTTIFLLIFTRAIALMKIWRKMVICEKLFVNFIKNSVIIDKNLKYMKFEMCLAFLIIAKYILIFCTMETMCDI